MPGGVTLAGDSITNNGNSQTNNDCGVRIDGLTGTATFTNTTVSGSKGDEVRIYGTSTSANSATVTATGSTLGPQTPGVALAVTG